MMKTQRQSLYFLQVLIIFIILMAGSVTRAQSTLPDFALLDSCVVSQSTGYHDGNGWVDIDNDGDLDLIITNSAYNNKPNLLYRNERGDLFQQIRNTEYTLHKVSYALPGPFGDIDNDGDEDVVLVDWEGTNLWIYKNDGYGNLINVANLIKRYDGMVSLIDLNEDAFLDLVEIFAGESRIYFNDGEGNYSDYEVLEIERPNPTSVIFAMSFGDADNDGDFDMYLGNILSTLEDLDEKNLFYLNSGSGNFEKVPDTTVIVSDMATTLGVNWVDYDNDGDMDLYVLESTIYGPPTDFTGVLYENKGGLVFEEHIVEPMEYCNTHKTSSIWGDLDNDGDQDLLITVEKNAMSGHTTDLKHNILFQNNGDGSFTEIKEGALVQESSHTATLEDFDNDGDLDVLLVGLAWGSNGMNYLYENPGNDNSWCILTCEGRYSSRTPYGARVQAIAHIDGKRVMQTREITPTTGHNTTYPSSRLHFGLGDAGGVDTLIVKWPLGHVDVFTNVKANHFYRAIEDSVLEVDFKATNYIRQKSVLPDTAVYEGESLHFDLSEYYELVTGDTVPAIEGDTFSFSLYDNDNTDAVNTSLDGSILTITPATIAGTAMVRTLVSAGFTERVDGFRVDCKAANGLNRQVTNNIMSLYPNPAHNELKIEFSEIPAGPLSVELMDLSGKLIRKLNYTESQGLIRTIDIAKLEEGIYLLRVNNRDFSAIRKFIRIR